MYVALYHNLDFADVAQIEETLSEAGIDHRLGDGGSEVLVPVEDAPRARVALARDGLAVGGRPGLELFDKPAWGMTDFSQRVTYQRALEGELARTIAGIRGVERVQVHLALSAPRALRAKEAGSSASVVLALTPGSVLSPETIQGITYVVSNSVEQLTAENVAVMDDTGRVLSIPAGSNAKTGATNKHLETQRHLEEVLVAKIQELLAPVLGPDRVRAEVSVQMSFDKVDRTLETVGPLAGGAEQGLRTAELDGRFNAREFQRSEGSVGKVTRVTAAVVVDQAGIQAQQESETGYQLEQLEAMIRDAIGVDEARGDRLSLLAVPFEDIVAAEGGPGTSSDEGGGTDIVGLIERLLRPITGLVALVILGLVALKVLRLKPEVVAGVAVESSPTAVSPPAAALSGGTPAAGAGAAAPGSQADANLQVVRGWLKDA